MAVRDEKELKKSKTVAIIWVALSLFFACFIGVVGRAFLTTPLEGGDTEKVFIMAWDYACEKSCIGKAGYIVYKSLGMNIVSSYNVWKEEFGDRYNQEEIRKYTKEFLQKYYSENTVPVRKGYIIC